MEKNNISPIQSDFERIKKQDNKDLEYWTSRELCTALGYSTYQKFNRTLNKTIAIANKKGCNTTEHFNPTFEMVKLNSGSFRKVENIHLSRIACLMIAENADGKKPQVQMAKEYFKQEISTTELIDNSLSSNILLYKTEQGESRIEVVFNSETFWMSQKRMADLFGVETNTINNHLKEIFKSGELEKSSVIQKIRTTALDGKNDDTLFYNLDAVIAVGFRVGSYQASQFRMWATSVLKEMIIKGFVLDDERLKQGKHFGKDYFDDLLERIREIRTSERRYYQKITDVYSECSADYDPKAETTLQFFKMVQNRCIGLLPIKRLPKSSIQEQMPQKPHMGLTTWKNAPDGRVQKSDTIIAQNYLSDKEVFAFNRLSTAFLDLAELHAERQIISTMADWKKQLDDFLTLYEYDKYNEADTISIEQAKEKAYAEYDKFRLIQDKEFLSDFDKKIKVRRKIV
ncbi:RhuM family protein [Parabacteroides sp.]